MSRLDIFDLLNPPQLGQKKSRIDYLIDIFAFVDEFAVEAMEILDNSDTPKVAVFFQLPFLIFVESVLYKIPSLLRGLHVEFSFKPILLHVSSTGQLSLNANPPAVEANATQVIAYIPIWDRRRLLAFRRYEQCFTSLGLRNEIVLTEKEFWGGRTLRAEDFEHELASRILREIIYALRKFLKSYSIITKQPYAGSSRFYGSYMMPYPGRISHFGTTCPLLDHFLRIPIQAAPMRIDAGRVHSGIEFTNRKLSRFEHQIFELNRLAQAGNHALAVAGALSLIEWLFKLVSPKNMKKEKIGSLINYFSTRGLGDDRTMLDELRKLRNVFIHLGEYSDVGNKSPHEILNLDIDEKIKKENADAAIELAWRLFQKANSGKLQQAQQQRSPE